MNIHDIIHRRYATKKFQAERELSAEQLEQLKEMLQMSASSTNAQPWHFILATTAEGKKRIAQSTQGSYAFNAPRILDASAVVVFAARHDISDAYLAQVLEQENKDGRYANTELMQAMDDGRKYFVNLHRHDQRDLTHWAEKQLYLNLGSFLIGVAAMGLDAVAMEGFDASVLNAEFELSESGFGAAVIVPVGYHDEEDFNAQLPKSRLPLSELITPC